MQVHFGEELLRAEWKEAVGCIGTFDGVHLGHQTVISTAVTRAKERGLPCVLVTFDRHPASIIAPEKCPKPIASLSANIRMIRKLGVSASLILPFTHQLSETTAQSFLDNVLVGEVKAKMLIVGHDFAFGKGREGTPEWLTKRIETEVVPPFEMDGKRVSSSMIRRAVASGDMKSAQMWLGRPFQIEGIVVSGQKLGRQLGFPTINIARSYGGILPVDGIYGGLAHLSTGTYKAAISIGYRPTVNGDHRTVEAFLIDYPGEEIYGHTVRLEFLHRVRDELKFDGLEPLIQQMALDVEVIANEIALP